MKFDLCGKKINKYYVVLSSRKKKINPMIECEFDAGISKKEKRKRFWRWHQQLFND